MSDRVLVSSMRPPLIRKLHLRADIVDKYGPSVQSTSTGVHVRTTFQT